MKSDTIYLTHILEMIERIESVVGVGREVSLRSSFHQDAVLRNLHTMTETTQRLSAGLREAHPEVEWTKLARFRNVLVHDYLGIDIRLIWEVMTRDLPVLKERVLGMLSER